MRKRARVVASALAALGLAGAGAGPALAQSPVVVPIVIRVERAAPSAAASIGVTVRTASPRPRVTVSRVTVRDTTGAGRAVGPAPPTGALTTVPLGAPSLLIRTERRPGPAGTGAAERTRVTVEDATASERAVGEPAPVVLLRTAGRGQETLIVTTDAPIDAPIVILAP